MKFIVFGLGNYGASLSQKLVNLGHEVIGADIKMEVVEKWKNNLTHTVALDAGSPEAINALPIRDVDVVVNAIGENEGSNIMLTALLKQHAVPRIICRVTTPLQKTVLEAMGIVEFVYPEADSAERMAYQLDLKGVMDSHKINDKYQLIDVLAPEKYIDHTIGEIPFAEKYKILPITIIRSVDERNILGSSIKSKQVSGLLSPETQLRRGDRLLLFGESDNLEDFVED
jgi:trk system potassium uptake protein TrkA